MEGRKGESMVLTCLHNSLFPKLSGHSPQDQARTSTRAGPCCLPHFRSLHGPLIGVQGKVESCFSEST